MSVNSNEIYKGTYIGDMPAYKDKTALVRFAGNDKLWVQFDDLYLREAFGWHLFSRDDFEIRA